MKRKRSIPLLILLAVLCACLGATQLQPAFLRTIHAVDGSFGIRPTSHACAGLKVRGINLTFLPAGDVRFQAGRFSFRYWVDKQASPERLYCIGQDIWYGE